MRQKRNTKKKSKQSKDQKQFKDQKQIDPLELKVRSVFLGEMNISDEEKLILVRKYLKREPKYLNEIKHFLKEKDEDLYLEYANCFINNPGVKEAFGIEAECEIKPEIKRVVSLKPVLREDNEKKDETKKKISRKNKKEVREKYKERESKKKEYEKKLSKIHEKIKSKK